ncbi:hypothetical protein EDD29_3797 [Actinocorallia herbida]|uniref:Uncharacterized protein n=1 Tax=Actinocorallia herbida TaxID=58109 RepID=A0A3N1CY76_9ACTN|nr:hypothetical protein [Actinocorallia herbida]ROO86234.1 hypothetical protein EDD29_3797 [Actinocorallia herbida]
MSFVNGLRLPALLLDLLADGSWRHPGDEVLRAMVPWFPEPLDFLADIHAMRRESGTLSRLSRDDPGDGLFRLVRGRGTPVEPPWLDTDLAVLIAVNRHLGEDIALALDYRTDRADPRVVGSDLWTDPHQCSWRVVAPAFTDFAATLGLAPFRRHRYVGPAEIGDRARAQPRGRAITSQVGLTGFLVREPDHEEPFTYVVDVTGALLLAPRRSEHVACAGGEPVLGAGEITFARTGVRSWSVSEISNQSTGYCPDTTSWAAVAAALDRVGLARPAAFTCPVVFRRCPACHQLNLVKDEDYRCAVCDGPLPATWNADLPAES